MIALSKDRHASLLALHGWSAVFLGLLLYWVILTGSVAVFAQEINAWANPVETAQPGQLPDNIDALIQPLLQSMPPHERDLIILSPGPGGLLRAFVEGHEPEHAQDEGEHHSQQLVLQIDPRSGEIVSQRDLLAEEHDPQHIDSYPAAMMAIGQLAEFYVQWHVNLHVPAPWGLLLTGILGLAMLVAALTGLLIHRHLLAELFTLRRFKGGLLKERDSHVLAGTWSLPFAFVLAFTGSFFSLAGSFGIPAVAMVSFGGDQEKLAEALLGTPPVLDERLVEGASIDLAIADVQQRFDLQAVDVSLFQSSRASAQMHIGTLPPEDGLVRRVLVYDGVSGAFLREKPLLGESASAGAAGLGLMSSLHFGNFAGVWSKLAWLSLGLAAAYVSFTGLSLFTRRREDQRVWRLLGSANIALGYGLPLALATTAWAYFLASSAGLQAEPVMMVTLALTLLTALLLSASRPQARAAAVLRHALALGLVLLPGLRWLCSGVSWTDAMQAQWIWVITLDLSLALTGLLLLWPSLLRKPVRLLSASPSPAEQQA